MINTNHFKGILDSGYIISEVTESLLKDLSQVDPERVDYFQECSRVGDNYEYSFRLTVVHFSIDFLLLDNLITKTEYDFIQSLKSAFKIEPGDFYNKLFGNVQAILLTQFHLYYLDNRVDILESNEIIYLKSIFDLDDQQIRTFELSEFYDKFNVVIKTAGNRYIPESVKKQVWERDGGKCILCGSTDQLEFDHDIPFGKGGSCTLNNVRLLCRNCNRSKSDKIGYEPDEE